MRTTRWAPLAVVPLLALTSIAGLSAQEQEKQPERPAYTQQAEKGQEAEISVRLEAVENSGVNGSAVVRFGAKADPRQQAPETRPERVEIVYDLTGLEANGTYRAVIHQGACATSTTLVASLGTLTADENGRLRKTVEVRDQKAIAALGSARELATRETQEREAERQRMANENRVRHLQLQSNGEPVACGNFEISSKP